MLDICKPKLKYEFHGKVESLYTMVTHISLEELDLLSYLLGNENPESDLELPQDHTHQACMMNNHVQARRIHASAD